MRLKAIAVLAGVAVSGGSYPATHMAKVAVIEAMHLNYDCYYFTLEGVAVADPSISQSPWFAVDRAQYGAKDGFATLLAAKAMDRPIEVRTSGATICGAYAQVAHIDLQ